MCISFLLFYKESLQVLVLETDELISYQNLVHAAMKSFLPVVDSFDVLATFYRWLERLSHRCCLFSLGGPRARTQVSPTNKN